MEIRLYRERPTSQRPGKPIVSRLWDYLVKKQETTAKVRARKAKSAEK
jgi:hypothetical protein